MNRFPRRRRTGSGYVVLCLGLAAAASGQQFVDVTGPAGLQMRHRSCGSGEKYLVETMGSGIAWLDYDGDGWVDLYAVQGGPLPGCPIPPEQLRGRLFRNQGDGTFRDRTGDSGLIPGDYGQGVAAGDYDGDGDPDLYLANFGADRLYRNDGDGRFTDVTGEAGLGSPLWSSSAAFGDFDGDGDLDLYVVHYLDWTVERHIYCTLRSYLSAAAPESRAYCHPDLFDGVPDALYRNGGDGRFEEVSAESGLDRGTGGKGLGIVLADLDGDLDLDLYVANDSTPNHLYENDGRGHFTEIALLSGTAFNEDGHAEAGMGVDAGDLDGDGRFDLFVTNLSGETNTLYRNLGDGLFADETDRRGLGPGSLPFVGFGTRVLDFDQDGDLDLLVANGHLLENIALVLPALSYEQPMLAYRNDGRGRFTDVSASLGPSVRRPVVGRALATADYDRDGDLDVAVTSNDGDLRLLENRGGSELGRSIEVLVTGTRSNRDGIGAQIVAEADGRRVVRAVQASGSYQSSSDRVVHFGLGNASRGRFRILWPSGLEEDLGLVDTGQVILVTEGRGITGRKRYRASGGDSGRATVRALRSGNEP